MDTENINRLLAFIETGAATWPGASGQTRDANGRADTLNRRIAGLAEPPPSTSWAAHVVIWWKAERVRGGGQLALDDVRGKDNIDASILPSPALTCAHRENPASRSPSRNPADKLNASLVLKIRQDWLRLRIPSRPSTTFVRTTASTYAAFLPDFSPVNFVAEMAAEMHADGWLGKPFESADLEAIVHRFAARSSTMTRREAEETETEKP